MPAEPEVHGLLALMLLIEARRAARVDAGRRPGPARGPGPPALGPRADRGRPALVAAVPARGTGPARIRSRRRSTPSTATRRRGARPTGGRSSRSTISSCRSRPARSSRSTARSLSPRSRARGGAHVVDRARPGPLHLFHAIRADLLRAWAGAARPRVRRGDRASRERGRAGIPTSPPGQVGE